MMSTMAVRRSFLVGLVLFVMVTEVSSRATSNSTLLTCATHAVQKSRQNLSNEIGKAKGDFATALRISSQSVTNVTLNQTEAHFLKMRDLILDHVTNNMEKCFRPARYSMVPLASPMCLARSGIRLQRQINRETRKLAQMFAVTSQQELLELGGGGTQFIVLAASDAFTKAALPLARNVISCVYGERIASTLKL